MENKNAFKDPCAGDGGTGAEVCTIAPTTDETQLNEMTATISGGVVPDSCPNYVENDDVANSMAEGYF